MNIYSQIKKTVSSHKNLKKAQQFKKFFKTGKGEYSEGDKFLGIMVPVLRKIAKQYEHASLSDLEKLIQSSWHEERLLALFILILQFEQAKTFQARKKYYQFYVKQFKYINNWDLVDQSSHGIVGAYLYELKDSKVLYQWATSKHLWTRRIAMVSTHYFIRHHQFKETLKVAELLLQDNHDLIHKAVGWMLRELGKRDQKTEETFLKKHYKKMPRTMLRYAIERFDEKKRQAYLKGKV